MARLRSITNSNLNLRRREDKADADADDDNLRAQVTGDLPGHSITSPTTTNQSINHRHLAAAACKRM